MSRAPNPPQSQGPIDSLPVFLARIFWAGIGPVILVLIVMGIITRGSGWTTTLDASFVVIVAAMIIARWLEQRSGTASTLDGKPAGRREFTWYLTRLVVAATVVWVVANVLGNHVMK